jgi:hypothetical protein
MRCSFLIATVLLAVGCNPIVFDEISESASTRVLARPETFSPTHAFGGTLDAYEITLGGERVSRVAVGGGPGAPIFVYAGWQAGQFEIGPPLRDACDDEGDCLPSAGAALIGISRWRAAAPMPGEGCVLLTAPEQGGYSVVCENRVFENIPGSEMTIDLGVSGEGLVEGSSVGLAILGAPGANAGAGGIFRVPDGFPPSELMLPAGTAPPGSRLGTDIDVESVDATRALVAAAAPEGGRVVVLSVMGDGSVEVHACIDHASAGFAASVALGDVDGDGATDVVVGNARSGTDEIRVYPGSGMPASGCVPWGAAPITIACPDVEGFTCNGSGFGADVAVGDLDGDGIDDIAIGAPGTSVDGEERAGAVYFVAGAPGGPTVSGASARTHSQPAINDEVGVAVDMFTSGIGTSERMEPVASSTGREAVLAFLCSGLDGDTPDSDAVAERCAPR